MRSILFIIFFLFCLIQGEAQNWKNLDYNSDQPGLEHNPLKGFTTLWNPGNNNFPYSILGHSFGLNEVMKGMNSFDWTVIETALKKDVSNGKFTTMQVIIDPANGTTKMPAFLINQIDWKLKEGGTPSLCPDWNNETLMQAILNFIAAFGKKYNNDPRVFSITLGLYGMWGEWHVGSDKTYEMTDANQARIANAYRKAFPETNLKARYATSMPDPQIFGYSDGLVFGQSWYFYKQLKTARATENWKQHIISGEIDPGVQGAIWKSWPNTVGEDVTTVMDSVHPTFLISNYVLSKLLQTSTEEWKNAIRAQKMMGYTLCVNKYRLTAAQGKATVEVEIQNKGVAPMYANWDAEIGVLDNNNQFQTIGKTTWNLKSIIPDNKNHYRTISALNAISDGTYTVLLRIVNPLEKFSAQAKPMRFANVSQDAHKEGWITLGSMTITGGICGVPPIRVSGITATPATVRLPNSDTLRISANVFPVDATRKDMSWISDHPATVSVDANGLVTTGKLVGQATITAITQDGGFVAKNVIQVGEIAQKTWVFPGDTTLAWQYKYYPFISGDTLFAQDSAQTIGIYGCNDTTGLNVRLYTDANQYKNAAQFKWNSQAETFQKNGQWVEYSVRFTKTEPFQLLVRARNNVDAKFKFILLKPTGDTLFFGNLNLKNDFINLGGGNEKTDWFLSRFPIPNIVTATTARFDWYDNVGEPGIFGSFSFVKSALDLTPPKWVFINLGTFPPGTDIALITNEDTKVYFVPPGTAADSTSIKAAAVASVKSIANKQAKLATTDLKEGSYVLYAIDASNNISEVSKTIILQNPVSAARIANESEITVLYNHNHQIINAKSSKEISQINVYNILGSKVGSKKCNGNSAGFQTSALISGVYIIHVSEKDGTLTTRKVVVN